MFQFALQEFKSNIEICWQPYYKDVLIEQAQKDEEVEDEFQK